MTRSNPLIRQDARGWGGPLRRISERKSPWVGVQPPCDYALLEPCGHAICIPRDWGQDTVACGECLEQGENR